MGGRLSYLAEGASVSTLFGSVQRRKKDRSDSQKGNHLSRERVERDQHPLAGQTSLNADIFRLGPSDRIYFGNIRMDKRSKARAS
jgi:hypothetical protein